MSGYGLVGSDTPIDDLLREYFPGAPQNVLYELFESEQAALLAALLMEMRDQETQTSDQSDAEANYYADEVEIGPDEDETSWDYPAGSVLVYGFSSPISVAFKGTNRQNREIYLDPNTGHDPADFSPPGGLGASQIWHQTEDGSTTTAYVIAFD